MIGCYAVWLLVSPEYKISMQLCDNSLASTYLISVKSSGLHAGQKFDPVYTELYSLCSRYYID